MVCPACGKNVPGGERRCVWCNKKLPHDSPIERATDRITIITLSVVTLVLIIGFALLAKVIFDW